MIRRHLIVSFLCSMVLSHPALAQSVDELVNKHLEACGGLEKLKAVKSMELAGKWLMAPLTEDRRSAGPGKEESVTVKMKRPNFVRTEILLQGQALIQAYDGENSWGLRPGATDPDMLADDEGGVGEMSDMFLKELSDLDGPLVDYKDKWNKVELVGKENVDGNETYKLKLSPKDGYVRYIFLDTKTFNTAKVTRPGSEFLMETYYRDYKPVNGLMIPHTIESKVDGQTFSKITLEKAQMDVPLEDAIFKLPTKAQN